MWVALFSQTGSEIVNISKRIRKHPDFILTNNLDSNTWHPDLNSLRSVNITGKHTQLMDVLLGVRFVPLVTLHGYLRILPPEVVNEFEIINGHPGDIITYPELKGKDPQQKAIDLKLPSTGCVLHRAVAEVDAGEIISHKKVDISPGTTTQQLINILKDIQLDLWCALLKEKL